MSPRHSQHTYHSAGYQRDKDEEHYGGEKHRNKELYLQNNKDKDSLYYVLWKGILRKIQLVTMKQAFLCDFNQLTPFSSSCL